MSNTTITFGNKRRQVTIPEGFEVLKPSEEHLVRKGDRFLNCFNGKFEDIDQEDLDDRSPISCYACIIRNSDNESRKDLFVPDGTELHIDR